MGRLAFPALFMKHSARGGRGDAATQRRQTPKAPSGPPWAGGRARKRREGAPGLDSMICVCVPSNSGCSRISQNRGGKGMGGCCLPKIWGDNSKATTYLCLSSCTSC